MLDILSFAAGAVLGVIIGTSALWLLDEALIAKLNGAVNKFREGTYTARENAHWWLEQIKNHVLEDEKVKNEKEEEPENGDDDCPAEEDENHPTYEV